MQLTTAPLVCCVAAVEHWNSLPPHTTCSAAAQQLHLRGVPSTGQSPSVPSQTVTIAWCSVLHCMQYAPTCKAVANPDAQVAHPHVRPSWLHASRSAQQMPDNPYDVKVNTAAAHLTGGLPNISNTGQVHAVIKYCAMPLQGNPAHAVPYCTLCDRAAQGLLVRISCSHPMS